MCLFHGDVLSFDTCVTTQGLGSFAEVEYITSRAFVASALISPAMPILFGSHVWLKILYLPSQIVRLVTRRNHPLSEPVSIDVGFIVFFAFARCFQHSLAGLFFKLCYVCLLVAMDAESLVLMQPWLRWGQTVSL